MSDLISIERRGRVLVVDLCREHKRNAIDRAMADALSGALDLLEDDEDLWAGVLSGAPGIFSAGSDLTAGGDYLTERGGEYGIIRRRRTKPLVAAVDGPALGGGLEIVLACDMVVASTRATFGLPEVRIGVVPTCAGLFRAPRALAPNLARELILTGQPFDARRAEIAGLVNRVVEPGEAREAAIELAAQVCENAPLSVRACLSAVNDLLAKDDDDGWAITRSTQRAIAGSEDVLEGVASFLEKRPPVWRAR